MCAVCDTDPVGSALGAHYGKQLNTSLGTSSSCWVVFWWHCLHRCSHVYLVTSPSPKPTQCCGDSFFLAMQTQGRCATHSSALAPRTPCQTCRLPLGTGERLVRGPQPHRPGCEASPRHGTLDGDGRRGVAATSNSQPGARRAAGRAGGDPLKRLSL